MNLQVTFRNIIPSTLVEDYVRNRAEALEKHAGMLKHCHVVIENPYPQHRHGSVFRVRVDLGRPLGEAVADPGALFDDAHEDVFVAIRDAFDDTRRRLEGRVPRQPDAIEHDESAAAVGAGD